MKSKLILTSSAILLALTGLSATFFPHELLTWFQIPANGHLSVLIQVLGALYLGFAILNWSAKGSTVGGIYNRPLTLGNGLHFFAAGMAMLKGAMTQQPEFWIPSILSLLFAALFFWIMFTHPLTEE